MLKISPLFSGSRGNCTLIQSDNVNILLDAGFGFRAITKALSRHGLTVHDVDAIVITHEHVDHVGALPTWIKHAPTPIYAPAPVAAYLSRRICFEVSEISGSFTLGNVTVDVYECSHDARCCFGYRFVSGNSHFACVTDTGCVTDKLIEFLSPCATVMLESNHDADMLIRGEYPYPLKQRILSDFGHLSNAQCCEVLCKIAHTGVKNVILAHLSEKNNTKELAFQAAVNTYAANGVTEGKDVNVYVADQYENEVTICID